MNRLPVPIADKYCLSIPEAAEYFGVGEKKIRQIFTDQQDSGLFLQNGSKILVKRIKFEEYLDRLTAI